MSTLAEIEQAVESLPRPEQEVLLQHLSARLQAAPARQWPVPPPNVSREEIRRIQAEIGAKERASAATALLQRWLDEDRDGEQAETGAWLVKTLEEDRVAQRSLFPAGLRGVTW